MNNDALAPRFSEFFREGRVVQTFSDEGTIRLRSLGEIILPTGRVVACDALAADSNDTPFTTALKPGSYPVTAVLLEIKGVQWVAAAAVGKWDDTALQWELALRPKQDPGSLKPGEIFGYPVDSGTGCFMDAAALAALMRGYDTDKTFFEKRLAPAPDNQVPDWNWANIVIEDQTGANMVLFSSGAGDGIYPTFLGINGEGNAVSMLTDFRISSPPAPVR
jgi:hypothetical protein